MSQCKFIMPKALILDALHKSLYFNFKICIHKDSLCLVRFNVHKTVCTTLSIVIELIDLNMHFENKERLMTVEFQLNNYSNLQNNRVGSFKCVGGRFLEKIYYIKTIRIQIKKNNWDLETYRKSQKKKCANVQKYIS